MAKTKTYGHYCAAARALEVVGEKWSLLIVRDLLQGPQRFSDLARTLGGITPKLLTVRLRELEASGVIDRDEEAGRREVWYRLAPAGEALRPVIEELLVWGVEHAPLPGPGDTVNPRRGANSTVTILNRRKVKPAQPTTWSLRLSNEGAPAIHFNGERWSRVPESDPSLIDLTIETDPPTWISLLRSQGDDRETYLREVRLTGDAAHTEEFMRLLSAPGQQRSM
jgi:DNA-binding HxlR family transcriptional regulator